MAEDLSLADLLKPHLSSATAIWLSAQVEEKLALLIRKRMSNLNRPLADKIFNGYGPLSSFSAKIDIAYAFGYVSKTTHQYLHAIKAIRNKFAHSSVQISFESESLAEIYKSVPGSFDSQDRQEMFKEIAVRCLVEIDEDKLDPIVRALMGLR